MYKTVLVIMLYSLPLNAALASKVALFRGTALGSSSPIQSVMTQQRTLSHDEGSVVLLDGFKSLLKREGHAVNVLHFAIAEKNYRFVEELLQNEVAPNRAHIKQAACLDDCKLVALLMAKEKSPKLPVPAYHLSLSMIKFFLANGGAVTDISGMYAHVRTWNHARPLSPVGDLTEAIREDVRWHAHLPLIKSYTKRKELLEKAVLLVQGGDPLSFIVNNPLSRKESIEKYGTWSGSIECRYAEGDWTFGAFPDLAKYIQAASVCRRLSATAPEKEEAQKIMHEIIERYAINKEAVTIDPEDLSGSSRIVEE